LRLDKLYEYAIIILDVCLRWLGAWTCFAGA